ncbi:ABC transporter substrate-binding protein [Desulfonatronospira sp.]|uniref:ABC transporter substrate-binding protein n=1 Tax=Desulfonatronospira sp. TaxID=1962951 RepID=UPI0025C4C2FA|nr:ABC transporter substrate-binding protein [Desulfonatronospira sp.]
MLLKVISYPYLAHLFTAFSLIFFLVSCKGDIPPLEREEHDLPQDAEVSSTEPGNYGGVLVTAESQQPRTFNPLVAEDAYSSEAIGRFLNGLTTYHPIKEKVVPELARSWEISKDKRTITMELRRGVRWSDGEPFTADDVIFTFKALFDQRYPNRYMGQYTIAGEPIEFEKLDRYTVRFTTARPYSPFLYVIGFIGILPRHVHLEAYEQGELLQQWSVRTAMHSPEEFVGTGPFRVRSFRPGQRIVYEPNPHYWRVDSQGQRLPYVDYLITRYVQDRNTETVLFASGQIDIASITPGDVVGVRKNAPLHDYTVHHRGPATGIRFLWFNQKPGESEAGKPFVEPHKLEWFTSRKFRQAILHGLDREGLIQSVYFGRAELLHSIISPANERWHNPDVPRYPYDPDRALELLREEGFELDGNGDLVDSKGNQVSFQVYASEGDDITPQILSTFRENMRDLGIRVRIRYLDFGTLVARVSRHFEYEGAMMGFTGGADPSGGRAIYLSSGRLHLWNPEQEEPQTDWEARIDELVYASEETFDLEERVGYVHQMQEVFSEELPLLYLVTPHAYVGLKDRWENVRIPAMGSVIWNIDELYLGQEK